MNNSESMRLAGYIDITVRDKNGNVKEHSIEKNVIVDVGLPELVKLAGGIAGFSAFNVIAVGSGTTAEDRGQTALATELTDGGFARATVTPVNATWTGYVANGALKISKTFVATASRTVAEVGIFNASNVMIARKKLTTAKPLDLDETITFDYYLVFGLAV